MNYPNWYGEWVAARDISILDLLHFDEETTRLFEDELGVRVLRPGGKIKIVGVIGNRRGTEAL